MDDDGYEGPCDICGLVPDDCKCPECPECGMIGDPYCYEHHGLTRYEPRDSDPLPLQGGMTCCPYCGNMIVAGVPHPDYTLMNDPDFGPDPSASGPVAEWDDIDIGF